MSDMQASNSASLHSRLQCTTAPRFCVLSIYSLVPAYVLLAGYFTSRTLETFLYAKMSGWAATEDGDLMLQIDGGSIAASEEARKVVVIEVITILKHAHPVVDG